MVERQSKAVNFLSLFSLAAFRTPASPCDTHFSLCVGLSQDFHLQAVDHARHTEKGAKPKAAPFSPINYSPCRELERDSQPQPYCAPAVNAFLRESLERASEVRVRADVG